MMTVGSLFSGVGGIEIGFEREGFKTLWFIENDLYCQAVLRKRFPEAKIYGDIKEVDFGAIQKPDVLTGGFPCQDISNAGKRAGIEGSRSSLWKYYCEAIRILRPKYALIENVSALAIRGLNVVLEDIAEIGYDAFWTNISASAIGAPHQRERLFVIAYSYSERFKEQWGKESVKEKDSRVKFDCEVSHSESIGCWKQGFLSRDADDFFKTESGICGMVDGVPNRVDQIKCLGNAVVPACAQVFAKAIKEFEGLK